MSLELKQDMRLYGFSPIANHDSRLLILGSMPSPESLKKGEYYGHAQNAFWRIMARLFKTQPANYQEKKDLLLQNGIALWDVLASCHRDGSGDAAICKPKANDIAGLLAESPGIKKVLLNGGFAARHWKKYCGGINILYVRMPSTSPANARMSFEEKFKIWAEELRDRHVGRSAPSR